jgi:hypothetical protein
MVDLPERRWRSSTRSSSACSPVDSWRTGAMSTQAGAPLSVWDQKEDLT